MIITFSNKTVFNYTYVLMHNVQIILSTVTITMNALRVMVQLIISKA